MKVSFGMDNERNELAGWLAGCVVSANLGGVSEMTIEVKSAGCSTPDGPKKDITADGGSATLVMSIVGEESIKGVMSQWLNLGNQAVVVGVERSGETISLTIQDRLGSSTVTPSKNGLRAAIASYANNSLILGDSVVGDVAVRGERTNIEIVATVTVTLRARRKASDYDEKSFFASWSEVAT